MMFDGILVDAFGKPLVNAKVGIVPRAPEYSLDSPGWWGSTDENGYFNIYTAGDLTNYALVAWDESQTTTGEFWPALQYAGHEISLGVPNIRKFPWWLYALLGGGLLYLLNKRKKSRRGT